MLVEITIKYLLLVATSVARCWNKKLPEYFPNLTPKVAKAICNLK